MPQNSEEILVATAGDVWIAPVSTTLPTAEDSALNGAFLNLGYTTEEGVSFTYSQAVEEINAWQEADPVRRIVTARSLTTTFNLNQWNQATFELAFGGGAWTTPIAGTYSYTPPDGNDALAEYALVIDFADGTKVSRLIVERGTVTEDVSTSLVRTGAAVLPIAIKALKPDTGNAPWNYLTGDAAFATAS